MRPSGLLDEDHHTWTLTLCCVSLSAGVGRTGTIIALDVLLQQLEKERAVGINAFVHKMRLSRPYMVQTEVKLIVLRYFRLSCHFLSQVPIEGWVSLDF